MRIIWGNNRDQARLWHLLYEALTETPTVQLIVLSYPLPMSMQSPEGINCNNTPISGFMSSWIRPKPPTLLPHVWPLSFARAYNDLILVVDGYEVWFVWWTSLIHWYLTSISWCISVLFSVQKRSCYFFPKYRILFSSRSEGLIVWRWPEYSCLWWSLYKFHILDLMRFSILSIMKLVIDETL